MKEKENKTKKTMDKIFKKLFIMLLVGFSAIYISEASGYFEFQQYNKKVLTEQKIKQFEEDVSNGKNIDLKDYVQEDTKSYESKVSKIGEKMSDEMEKLVVNGLNTTFKFLNDVLG